MKQDEVLEKWLDGLSQKRWEEIVFLYKDYTMPQFTAWLNETYKDELIETERSMEENQ